MSALARRRADVDLIARIHRMIENALPWYHPDEERKIRQTSAELDARLNRAMPTVESIRRDYAEMSKRLARR